MNARQANWQGSNWIRKERRLAIYMRDNFTCQYCGKNLANAKPKARQLDHVIPCLTGKPDNSTENLITSCMLCNNRKNGHNLLDWLKGDLAKFDQIMAQLQLPIDIAAAKAALGLI